MGVAFRGIEEEIADAGTGDVLVLGSYICEDDAGGDFGAYPAEGCFSEVFFAKIGEAEEPEDGFGDAGEDAEPGSEGCWLDLSQCQRQWFSITIIMGAVYLIKLVEIA